MSQKLSIVALGVVVLALGVWWLQTTNNEEQAEQASAVVEERSEADTSNRESFVTMLANGESIECAFSGTDPERGEPMSGTVVASGDRHAVETSTTIDGAPVTMQMIQTDAMLYIWSNDDARIPAMMFDPSSLPDSDTEAPNTPVEWFDEPDVDMNYDCRQADIRADTFTPPSDIDFMNPFSGMEEMMEAYGAEGMPMGGGQ